MFHIDLTPQRTNTQLHANVQGDILILNHYAFDFTSLGEGETITQEQHNSRWIIGDVIRKNGDIFLTLVLPHGSNPSDNVAYPRPLRIEVDGVVELPK